MGARVDMGVRLAALLWLSAVACGDDASVTTTDAAQAMPSERRDAGDDAGHDASAASDAATASGDASTTDSSAPDDAGSVPQTLAETGLYVDGSIEELAGGVVPYAPAFALWSDGADKQRWLWLPAGAQIDTSDMDHWRFPVGTKAWKEFSRDGKRLETRLLEKNAQGWFRAAYLWNEAGTEATIARDGAQNVLGTSHDVPDQGDCGNCHDGVPDRLLGVSALQLSHAGAGLTLDGLIADERLSDPPAATFALPDEPAWNALGYLHANCGNCHNPHGEAFDRASMDLWLRTAQLGDVTGTEAYTSSVGVPLSEDGSSGSRVEPGAADSSGLIVRMSMRGTEASMPPLGSEEIDADGIAVVSEWIDGL